MAYTESLEKEAEEYNCLYGDLPDNQKELIEYIINHSKLKNDQIQKRLNEINLIPWHEIKLAFNRLPYATPRPRNSNGIFYVKGAKKHRKLMEQVVTKNRIIYTQTNFIVKTYQPTPKGMSQLDRLMFEMGAARPLADPDWDNLGKTYSDMVQKVLLVNDNIISSGYVDKFYSIKPRIEVIIRYQERFDTKFNERKMLSTKGFKELVTERYDI